jgi:hypothetical protein
MAEHAVDVMLQVDLRESETGAEAGVEARRLLDACPCLHPRSVDGAWRCLCASGQREGVVDVDHGSLQMVVGEEEGAPAGAPDDEHATS